MADYRLTQSGDQVQEILNNAAMQSDLTAEQERAELAEQTLQNNIDAEALAREQADGVLDGKIDANTTRIVNIEGKIPSGASTENKLTTESEMNSAIATATATFRGTYNLVSDLGLAVSATHEQIATALAGEIAIADNNDYCFVQIPTSESDPTQIAKIERYKYNGSAWAFEYELNNSGFTAEQWAAINSGITASQVAALPGMSQAIEAILVLIPSAASALNQLADKAFVNSSVSTNTATFRGTFNLITDLNLSLDATRAQVAAALLVAAPTADNNDYAFVQIPTSAQTPTEISATERYKFNGTAWAYEYSLNTSGFTAQQWNAINSGITSALVTLLGQIIPSAATAANQLADKAYVLAQILAAIPSFKGQFTTLADLQAVASPKSGDLGIVRTTDSDGYAVFTFYQYLNNQWNVYFTLSHHNQKKPATTGTTGDYPYNGMGRIVLDKDVDFKTQVESVTGGNTIFLICYDFILTGNVSIPANCVLEFNGGSISNTESYTINFNNSLLVAGENDYILKNIAVSNIANSVFFIAWIIGSSSTVDSTDIDRLPSNCCVDFSNRTITCNGNINYTGKNVNWRNLTLISKNLTLGGFINKTTTCYKLYSQSPITIDDANGVSVDDLALIVTSAGTPIDNRPDPNGIPTLRTGLLSKVRSINGNNIELEDYIEAFNPSTDYNGNVVYSTIEFCNNPVKVSLKNCKFYFLPTFENPNICGGALINWCEKSVIENCIFEPADKTKGSLVLLTLSGAYNCSIINTEINYALGEDMNIGINYGIQFDCSSRNSVENCKFYMNRRSVDFSGRAESRYNIISNCIIGGSSIEAYGSGIGGHSTSYGNVYQNNLIEGPQSVGVTCRGRNEKVMGNHFEGEFSLGFSLGYCTIVIGNTQPFVPGVPNINNVFISEDAQNLTLCTIKDNILAVNSSVFISAIIRAICQNNTFIGPTTATMFASGITQDANSYFKGNKILENVSPNNVIYED